MTNKIEMIRASWTYRHIQLIVIIGLILGIYLSTLDLDNIMPADNATLVYVKAESVPCDLDCEILERTTRIFAEKTNIYMEESRLEALSEMRDELVSRLDDSPYYNYASSSEKFGY